MTLPLGASLCLGVQFSCALPVPAQLPAGGRHCFLVWQLCALEHSAYRLRWLQLFSLLAEQTVVGRLMLGKGVVHAASRIEHLLALSQGKESLHVLEGVCPHATLG
jgi:hypothetical protein